MAEGKKSFIAYADVDEIKTYKEALDIIYNVTYHHNDYYRLSFINQNQYQKIQNALSYLRRTKYISGDEHHLLNGIFKHQYDNKKKINDLISQEPRLAAQRFIGRKKIREFIFKRDNYTCLNCERSINLTIDHIIPINKGGENKLSNLQTLCKSCNCSKSDTYKDYR